MSMVLTVLVGGEEGCDGEEALATVVFERGLVEVWGYGRGSDILSIIAVYKQDSLYDVHGGMDRSMGGEKRIIFQCKATICWSPNDLPIHPYPSIMYDSMDLVRSMQ